MNLNVKQSWSLKTKLTISTATVFLFSIWSLTFYASRVLHKEMKDLVGEQQFSAVSFIAADINQDLATRFKVLEMVSFEIKPSMLNDTTSLQALLEQRPLLQVLFNGGVFATGTDGVAIAEVPLSAKRIGVNYMDRTSVSIPIKEGKSMIGRPAMGKKLGAPIFSISVPICNTQGTVIGVLLGTINLSLPSFLDEITNNHYGKTGGYLLVAPQYEVVVTATDKRRIMTPTSRPGAIPLLDRFRQGYEGSGIIINPLGEEVLASAKGIPVAGWYIVAALPTTEAFAPIHKMQLNILLAAILLTLITAGLIWWILKGLLAPMFTTIEILSDITDSGRQPHLLPIARKDEIGKLIGSFNKLLAIMSKGEEELQNAKSNLEKLVAERTVELQESEQRFRLALRNSPVSVAIQDRNLVYQWAYNQKTRRADEIIGKTDADLFAPEEVVWINEIKHRVLESGTEEHVAHWVTSNGQRLFLDLTYVPLRDSAGEVTGIGIAVVNLTNQKLAEEALRESDERLRFAQDVAGIGVWEWNPHSNQTIWSPEIERMYGVAPGTLTDFETWRKLVYPEDLARIETETAEAIANRSRFSLEFRIVRPSGEIRWISALGGTIYDDSGRTVRAFGVNLDITERKLAEQALKESEEQFHALADSIPNLAWRANGDGDITWYNQRWYEYTGTTSEQMEGWGWQSVHDPVELPKVLERWQASLTTSESFDMTFPLRGADGVFRPFLTRVIPLKDEAGRVQQWFGTNTDVSELKSVEEERARLLFEVQNQAAEMDATLSSMVNGLIVYDMAGQAIRLNDTAKKLLPAELFFNTTVEERLRVLSWETESGQPFPLEEIPVARALRGETTNNVVLAAPFPDRKLWILSSAAPIRTREGKMLGAVATFIDITADKQADEALKASLAEKEVMLREIHHRVKNNLQVISSLVSLQADNLTDARIRDELNDVRDRVRSMALIHEKLYQASDLAHLNFADYAANLLRSLWRSHGTLAEKARLNLELTPIELTIEAAVPCGLILNELAGNALKHAFPNDSGGEVTVGLEHDPSIGTVCLRVSDNGIGLPTALDWQQSRSLGLRLVQILAGQLHGTVETGTGTGTEFRVTFPLKGFQA